MSWTRWHITFGTYGGRLHGGDRPSVDRRHNQMGAPFIEFNPGREYEERISLRWPSVRFTREQQRFIQRTIPVLCERGSWRYVTCAAAPDHVHTVLEADSAIHGKSIRTLLKRWIGQQLSRRWPVAPERTWWAEGGSNKAAHDPEYAKNMEEYVRRQRAPD